MTDASGAPAVGRATDTGALLNVAGLGIERHGQAGTDTIVAGVDLSLAAGDTIGIVGESGSGKSMTARAITGLLPPTLHATGEVLYGGRNLLTLSEREWREVRGREIGLILQDPFTMLNPVLKCGTILAESLLGGARLSRAAARAEAVRRLEEVGIRDPTVIDRYPFQLSGGMRQRVAIAAGLARDPRLLIADEPSTALDVTTQREILMLIKNIQRARGMGFILITHDLRVAFGMCDRIYVLYAGSVLEVANAPDLEAEPLHPYSHGLLLSEPPVDRRLGQLTTIPGSVPAPDDVAGKCSFAPRCPWAERVCQERISLQEVVPGRFSACIRIADIRSKMADLRVVTDAVEQAPEKRNLAAPLIVAESVSKVFGNGNKSFRALDNVTIEVGTNESVGLVGESGSGKTTIARILVGLEQASGGKVVIDGIQADNWAKLGREDLRKLRSTVQVVFQDPYSSLNPMRSIGWTLSEAITTHAPRARNVSSRVSDLLSSVGLPSSYGPRKPAALSGGERQRVAIARALAVKPKILICDEPVSALDMSVQAQILNLFMALRADRGIGYLFITHDLSIVRQISDYLYVLYRGQVVESGPTEGILNAPRDPYTLKLLESVPRSGGDWLDAGAVAEA